MKPLLAHIYEPHRFAAGYVQPKLNGVRALYQMGHFQSREELPWNANVLKHLSDVLFDCFEDSLVLDGELYKHGWPLQKINGAVQIARTQPSEFTSEIEYHIFDRVSYQLPFRERLELIMSKASLLSGTKIKIVETHRADSPEEANKYYCSYVAKGYEGMMYRLGDCPYTRPKQPNHYLKPSRLRFLSDKDNRTWHLLKRKDWQDDEFAWGAMFEGEGKQAGMLGAFGCITEDGKTFKVGSGLTDAERIEYWNNPPNGKKIKVKYLCLTSDGIPFNPTIEAIL